MDTHEPYKISEIRGGSSGDGDNGYELTHHIYLCYLGLRGALHRRREELERGLCHPRVSYTAGVPLPLNIVPEIQTRARLI